MLNRFLSTAWSGILTAMGLYIGVTTLMYLFKAGDFAILTFWAFIALTGATATYGAFALIAMLGIKTKNQKIVNISSIVMLVSTFISLIGIYKLPFLEIPIIGFAMVLVSLVSLLAPVIIKKKPDWA